MAIDRLTAIQQHSKDVLYVARKVAFHLPRNVEADDLYQEGMIALMLCADAHVGDTPLWAFARTRVQGAMIDSIRRRHWIISEPETHEEAVDEVADPYFTLVGKQLALKIENRRRRLEPRTREILRLLYDEGLKQHEVAAMLRVTESRVNQIKQAALNCLGTGHMASWGTTTKEVHHVRKTRKSDRSGAGDGKSIYRPGWLEEHGKRNRSA